MVMNSRGSARGRRLPGRKCAHKNRRIKCVSKQSEGEEEQRDVVPNTAPNDDDDDDNQEGKEKRRRGSSLRLCRRQMGREITCWGGEGGEKLKVL